MKILLGLHVIILVAIGACKELKSDPIPGFIPGTYTRYSRHEFGHEYDTLVIKQQSNLYLIERRWKYERILQGQAIEPEYRNTTMTGILNEEILTEQQTGLHYSFDLDKKCLYSGNTRYDKL